MFCNFCYRYFRSSLPVPSSVLLRTPNNTSFGQGKNTVIRFVFRFREKSSLHSGTMVSYFCCARWCNGRKAASSGNKCSLKLPWQNINDSEFIMNHDLLSMVGCWHKNCPIISQYIPMLLFLRSNQVPPLAFLTCEPSSEGSLRWFWAANIWSRAWLQIPENVRDLWASWHIMTKGFNDKSMLAQRTQ